MSTRRLAILLDDHLVPAWQLEILEHIREHPDLDITAFIVNRAKHEPQVGSELKSLSKLTWFLLDHAERFASRLLFRTPDSLEMTSIRPWLDRTSVIDVMPEAKQDQSGYFPADDVARIKALDLDVIIRFGFDAIRGDILDAARYGIWSYHDGDLRCSRGGPPSFWEWYRLEPRTSATLEVLTPDLDSGIVLQEACYMTFPRSWNENRNRALWKSTVLMTDTLEALVRSDAFVEEQRADRALFEENLFDGPLLVAPRFSQSVMAATMFLKRNVEAVFRRLFYVDQWRILLCAQPAKAESLQHYQEITPPKDRFWADPFFIRREDKTYIFVEEYKYDRKIGEIAVLEWEDGRLIDHRTIMSPEHHLSYPFLFEHRGDVFMIPETFEKRAIQLWRCVDFPDRWEQVADLMTEVSAVDTTLFEADGRWWMFTNIDRSRLGFGHNDELHAFYADSPLSTDWQPHAQNPLIRDTGYARQGGRVYRDAHGRLIRVAQNNTRCYGYALSFHEILRLTPTEFEARFLNRVEPTWADGVFAIHNFDTDGRTYVFDACFRRPKYW